MSWKQISDEDAALGAAMEKWQVPETPAWLAARIAANLIAPVQKSFWPVSMRTRVAAVAVALIVGWGAGMLMPAPDASADGISYAEVLW